VYPGEFAQCGSTIARRYGYGVFHTATAVGDVCGRARERDDRAAGHFDCRATLDRFAVDPVVALIGFARNDVVEFERPKFSERVRPRNDRLRLLRGGRPRGGDFFTQHAREVRIERECIDEARAPIGKRDRRETPAIGSPSPREMPRVDRARQLEGATREQHAHRMLSRLVRNVETARRFRNAR
jgi:hypothetical protein